MKIAIITITNSGLNFGNRLQNFALQETLNQFNVEVETIYSSNVLANSLLLSALRRKIKMIVKTSKRRRYFNKFNRSYINKAKNIRYGKLNENVFNDEYDGFIAGSDQVWNPYFHFNSDFEFMAFAKPGKRFSYAASFGVSAISDELKKSVSESLNGIKYISVREDSGQKIVKELTGRDSFVHVDPTLLLSEEDYIKIEEKPTIDIPDNYLLVYFLGEKTEEYNRKINELADIEKLHIVELSEGKDSKYYNIGPQHFLYLFHNSKYVCTDSFHGTAFSVIFRKRFTVFTRKDKDKPMNSRIDNILSKLGLIDRQVGQLDVNQSLKKIDYKDVYIKLELERRKANEYIKEIVEYINNNNIIKEQRR